MSSSGDTSGFQETSAEMVVSRDCALLKLIVRILYLSISAIRGGANGLAVEA